MRVPIPIAITSCILATGLVWYFNTRDADFTTPPNEEQITSISEYWKQKNTPPPSSSPLSSDLQQKKEPTQKPPKLVQTPKPEAESKPEIPTLPLGDLRQSPGLSEYGNLGEKGAPAMIQLATTLESKGAKRRARLAWERVLDTCQPTPEEVSQASHAIQQLSAKQAPWNTDPNLDITLVLHAGASLNDKKALEEALKTTAKTITQASGQILQIKIQVSVGKPKSQKTPRIPVAIWFSRPNEKPGETDAETPPLSFMADPSEEGMLTIQCQAGVYALLRAHLTEATSYTNLPEYPAGVKPDELLKYHVTRLMWREFAKSLK